MIDKVFQRVAANLAPAAKVLYIAEMLAWEKAFNSGVATRDPRAMRQVAEDLMGERSVSPLPFERCEEFIHDYCRFPLAGESLKQIDLEYQPGRGD